MLSTLFFICQLLFILSPAPSAAQQGSTDCGKQLGVVTLITQSDIDSISSCTTIFGSLEILLQGSTTGIGIGTSPTTFTLPTSLEFVEAQFLILTAGNYGTTSIVAPNLKTIGFGNLTSEQDDPIAQQLLISGGSFTTSFPVLTAISGDLSYDNYTFATLGGFPVLATVGGYIYINGSFSTLDLPLLTSAEDITILSTNPSFQCPSNIEPYFNCNITYCSYSPPNSFPNPYNCNPNEPTGSPGNGGATTPTGSMTHVTGTTAKATTSPTGAAATTGTAAATSASKASGAFALRCSGN